MPSLKEVRLRIASVNSTKQITSAMKLVAASKLRRAQDSILKMRPYAAKLKELLQGLSTSLEGQEENVFSAKRQGGKVLLVPISSNRGLCGAFNANVIKGTIRLSNEMFAEEMNNGRLYILSIGRKSSEFFRRHGYRVVSTHDEIFDNLNFENAAPLALSIMDAFAKGEYDKVILIHNHFKNAASQVVLVEQFLPIEAPSDQDVNQTSFDYIFEPNKEEIVAELIPKSLKIQFYKSLLDSFAAEHGARMTAMHQATDNAQELLKELRLSYNKARQAAITKEILEIVSGAEALKG